MSRQCQQIRPRPATLLPLGPWLRWGWHGLFVPGHSANQFMMFCLVGVSGVGVNALVMWAIYDGLGLHYMLSSVCAFFVANVSNFVFNKILTFADKRWGFSLLISQYVRFLAVSLIGLGINLAVLAALVELFGIDPVLANLAGVLVATFSNFLGSKFLAFKC
jgi:dolichol-phosphate mannosyltransferase